METKELTCKDVMVGDWVYNTHNKKNEQVQEIGSGKVMLNYNDLYELDEIEPIPLTPDILNKNRFSHNIYWHNIFKEIGNYRVNIQFSTSNKIEYVHIAEIGVDEFVPSKQTNLYATHIQHFHELQHILRSCGITIELNL